MRDTWGKIIGQGVIAGLIGFVTVGLIFAIANVFEGRSPFYTAALFGAAMFHGITDPARVAVTPENVLVYNGLHMVTFIVFGLITSALAYVADRGRQLWFVALFFLIFISFHLEAMVQGFAMPMRASISDVAVWGAGLVASVLMGAYLLWQHPQIRTRQAW